MPCNGRAAKRRWKEFRLKSSTSTDTFVEELNEYIYSPESVTLQDPAKLSSVLKVTQRFLIVWKNRLHQWEMKWDVPLYHKILEKRNNTFRFIPFSCTIVFFLNFAVAWFEAQDAKGEGLYIR